MATAIQESKPGEAALVRRLHNEADQIMVAVLWLLWAVSLGFSFMYGTWALSLVFGSAISLLGTLMWRSAPASLATRLVMGVGFMVYAALLIHQAHGLVETHFGIFVLLAFLLYYRDWRPLVLAAAVIAVHHAGFYYLQMSGVPVYVFQHAHMPVMVLVHAAYVVFETAVLVLMAVKLNQETQEAAILASLGADNLRSDEIDLDPAQIQSAGAAGQSVGAFLTNISHALREASAVAVSIRKASATFRSAGTGMVDIRNRQRSDIEQVVRLVESMDSVANHVAQESQRIAIEAGQCSQAATETGKGMAAAARSIDQLVQGVQQTAKQMTQLDEATAHIESMVSVIDNIAGQTNLLALNASIEAARAGEAGRGFAVVAGEVRRLSESTQNSAKNIQAVVESLRAAARSANDVADRSRVEAEAGGERMQLAGSEFQSIAGRLPHFASGMNNLSAEMSRQQALMQEINGYMSKISGFLEQTSSQVESVSSSGQAMDQMSERLYDSIRRFRNGEERFVA